jgi:cytidyltransferase-like protein
MYDNVYSIGCFDFLHAGHIRILTYMREKGKKVIIGIHDDDSLEKLKDLKKHEHESVEMRMGKLKKYADVVYIINNVDPTFCFKMMYGGGGKNVYIRANDNDNFPGRDFVEQEMDIDFFPYTLGVSSTDIRREKFG